jgi:hypothetical protein
LTEASAAGSWPARCRRPAPCPAAAALAADLLGDEVDQFAGLELAGQVGGDAGDQADLAVAGAGQHDGGALQLVLELVQRLAQGRGVGAFQGAASTLTPLTSTACAHQVVALAAASLRLQARSSFSSALAWSSICSHAPRPPPAAP